MPLFRVIIVLLLPACAVIAQEAENAYVPPSSNPTQLHNFNDQLYFVADDGKTGNELRRLNPKSNQIEQIADITPGSPGSEIDRLHNDGGLLWFRVKDEQDRGELWFSDGVAGGRTECAWRCSDSTSVNALVEIIGMVGQRLLFTIGSFHSTQTYMVYDVSSGVTTPFEVFPGESFVTEVPSATMYKGMLYISGRDARDQWGLWRSDATPEGTKFLHRFKNDPKMGVSLGDAGLLVIGETKELGIELWITQGEPETTHLVKDINEGVEPSEPSDMVLCMAESGAGRPLAYFAAKEPKHGRELWLTDGTPEGTMIVQDIVSGEGGSTPYFIFASRLALYFVASTLETGKELWVAPAVDGRYGPLVPSKEGLPGPESGEPYAMCIDGAGNLYYSLHEPDGEELWYSSILPDTAHQLLDINPKGISEPYGTTRVGDLVYFAAFDPVHGRELWRTQGPNRPPVIVQDLKTDQTLNPSSSPSEMAAFGDHLIFAADDIVSGNELWITDGTKAGTKLLKDIAPGEPSSNPAQITVVGDVAYFRAESLGEGVELWRTDGTPAGTVQAIDINPNKESSNPDHLIAYQGMLVFTAYRPQEGNEVWFVAPGREPDILKSVCDGPGSSMAHDFFVWKDLLFFVADDGIHGAELWRSDGTNQGTSLVRDIVMEPYEPIAFYHAKPAGDKLFLSGRSSERGQELWVMNSIASAPRLVRDIAVPEVLDTRARP